MDNEKRTARPFVLIECVGKHHSKRYNKSKYGLTHREGTVGIHLSFDVDAITPEYAPGTGTPVPNGITAREAFLAVEMLADSGKLLSMDLVEVNPILDERNKTGQLASDLIQLALGRKFY